MRLRITPKYQRWCNQKHTRQIHPCGVFFMVRKMATAIPTTDTGWQSKAEPRVWSHDHGDVGVCSFRHLYSQLFVASMSHRSKLCTSWVYISASTVLHQTTKTPQHVLLLQQPSATEQNCTVWVFSSPLASYRPAFLQARLQNEKAKYQIPHVYSVMNAQTVGCSSSLSIFMTDFCYSHFTRLEGRFLGKVYAKATFLACVTTWKVGIVIRQPVASRGVNGHSSEVCNKSDLCFESENGI